MGHEHHNRRAGLGPPVLDIGGDVGALVLVTPLSLRGREIEVSPVQHPDRRTHVEVLERRVGSTTFCAAVYGDLPAGTYRIWDETPGRTHEFTVEGGRVTELDWS